MQFWITLCYHLMRAATSPWWSTENLIASWGNTLEMLGRCHNLSIFLKIISRERKIAWHVLRMLVRGSEFFSKKEENLSVKLASAGICRVQLKIIIFLRAFIIPNKFCESGNIESNMFSIRTFFIHPVFRITTKRTWSMTFNSIALSATNRHTIIFQIVLFVQTLSNILHHVLRLKLQP